MTHIFSQLNNNLKRGKSENFQNFAKNATKREKKRSSSLDERRLSLVNYGKGEMYISCVQWKNGKNDFAELVEPVPYSEFIVNERDEDFEENYFKFKINIFMPKYYEKTETDIKNYTYLNSICLSLIQRGTEANKSLESVSQSELSEIESESPYDSIREPKRDLVTEFKNLKGSTSSESSEFAYEIELPSYYHELNDYDKIIVMDYLKPKQEYPLIQTRPSRSTAVVKNRYYYEKYPESREPSPIRKSLKK